MSRYSAILAIAASALVAIPSAATACGESLFRIGKGVSYRQYTAPLPGNILMIAKTVQEQRIAEWLAGAGHNVNVVDDPSRLQAFLETGKFDVVIGYFSDGAAVEAESASAESDVKFLPVVAGASAEAEIANQEYRETLTESDFTPKRLLKTIHRTIKSNSNTLSGASSS